MRKIRNIAIIVGVVIGTVLVLALIGVVRNADSNSNSTPKFSCVVALSPGYSNQWEADVTVTGPTPDITGGDSIGMLIIGFYDASGQELGTGSAFRTVSGIPAGQSLTYADYAEFDSGSGVTPYSCQVESAV